MPEDSAQYYLPNGLPAPVAESDHLSQPFLEGLKKSALIIQRCEQCQTWIFAPEWICYRCHSFDLAWHEIKPEGTIYSWERVWHPSHPALTSAVPYLVVLIEIPRAQNIRIPGNLLGDPMQPVTIDAPVIGVFEHHSDAEPPYSLLQWKIKV